jgi:hypothetical protein
LTGIAAERRVPVTTLGRLLMLAAALVAAGGADRLGVPQL